MSKRTFVGIDPGFTGAFGLIDDAGEYLNAWDLPVEGGNGRDREFDEVELNRIIHGLSQMQSSGMELTVGLEKPTSRPGEGGQRAHRFGEGIGMLRGMLRAHQVPYRMVSPNLWKGRLNLPGKQVIGANKACAQYLVTYHPAAEYIIYGSRGGIKDGRMDALLIAHWLRKEHYDKS